MKLTLFLLLLLASCLLWTATFTAAAARSPVSDPAIRSTSAAIEGSCAGMVGRYPGGRLFATQRRVPGYLGPFLRLTKRLIAGSQRGWKRSHRPPP